MRLCIDAMIGAMAFHYTDKYSQRFDAQRVKSSGQLYIINSINPMNISFCIFDFDMCQRKLVS